jgi:hypothetical protein
MRERSSIMDDLFLLYSSSWNKLLKGQGRHVLLCGRLPIARWYSSTLATQTPDNPMVLIRTRGTGSR